MELDKNERYSDYVLQRESREHKLSEAASNIGRIFAGESNLIITTSEAGDRRVRADIPDEDGYAGWVEHSSFIGLAEVTGSVPPKYVAERHFPYAYGAGKPTYLWEFTPDRHELAMNRVETDSGDQPFDILLPADDKHAEFFLQLTRDLLYAWQHNDYQRRLSFGKDYAFAFEQLR